MDNYRYRVAHAFDSEHGPETTDIECDDILFALNRLSECRQRTTGIVCSERKSDGSWQPIFTPRLPVCHSSIIAGDYPLALLLPKADGGIDIYVQQGIGKYPYDCQRKTDAPHAMIYHSGGNGPGGGTLLVSSKYPENAVAIKMIEKGEIALRKKYGDGVAVKNEF